MKTLVLTTFSILLLCIWVLIHLPLNLLHHHETICEEAGQENSKGEFHYHESAEEFCFFCSSSFVKDFYILLPGIVFSESCYIAKGSDLISIIFPLYKGLTEGRAPPVI